MYDMVDRKGLWAVMWKGAYLKGSVYEAMSASVHVDGKLKKTPGVGMGVTQRWVM